MIDLDGFGSENDTEKQVTALPDRLFLSRLSDPDKGFLQQFVDFRFVNYLKHLSHDFVYFLHALVAID